MVGLIARCFPGNLLCNFLFLVVNDICNCDLEIVILFFSAGNYFFFLLRYPAIRVNNVDNAETKIKTHILSQFHVKVTQMVTLKTQERQLFFIFHSYSSYTLLTSTVLFQKIDTFQ